jgi:uncharacterized membrane-anchored protein YitT (DUF2179 family)
MYILQRVAAMFIGSLLISIGINGFLVPHHLLDGGMTGIALILHYYFGFQPGLSMLVLSIPLFIYAWIYRRAVFFNSFLGLLVASTLIDYFHPLRNQWSFSIFPSVIFGGILIGIGVGIMLRHKTNTGGTDMLAQFISESFPINIGFAIILIDGLIVTTALHTLGIKSFFFSCVTICIIGIITSLIARPLHRYRF